MLVELRAARDEGDADRFRRAAHSLKSTRRLPAQLSPWTMHTCYDACVAYQPYRCPGTQIGVAYRPTTSDIA